MYQTTIQPSRVSISPPVGTGLGPDDMELEKTIGIALLADYNEQLAEIAGHMQSTLTSKKEKQAEIAALQMINARDSVEKGGVAVIEITLEEYEKLKNQYPNLNIKTENGKNYVVKSSLESVIAGKQQELAGLNSSSEIVALQIQSVVDQRKQAVTTLSNLMSSRDETLMGIIRNMKN